MRTVVFFCLVFFSLSNDSFAQLSPQIRRLPPSLERELKQRKGGRIRVIGFVDTLKAQNLIAQSIRDSSVAELDSTSVRDSAIIVIDSSVSMTDKEWLDSMLSELPEYRMTPAGVRFQYPAEILVETSRSVVPADTTLVSKMDPVTKEDLPLYDALPMPRPLERRTMPGTSIELAAGTPYLPIASARSLVISNEHSALELSGLFKITSSPVPAVKQFWQFGAGGNFTFPSAAPENAAQIPELDVNARTGGNTRLLVSQFDSTEHTLAKTDLDASFILGSPAQLKLRSRLALSMLHDEIKSGNSEDLGSIDIALSKDIPNSSYRIQFRTGYEAASSIASLTYDPHMISGELSLQQKENAPVRWLAGLGYIGGSDASQSITSFYPVINIRARLSPEIEAGAGFEPAPHLVALRDLLAENLFYSPIIALVANPNDSPLPSDKRSIVTEPIHLRAFLNYFISIDNELHGELRFIERKNEPVFHQFFDVAKHPIFDVEPENTRRIEFEAGASVRIFSKDQLRASVLFRSSSNLNNGTNLPYEPTSQLQAIYQIHTLSQKFIPQIELIHLARISKSLTFINLEARYDLSETFRLKCRAENIFNADGDFWNGYNEYPAGIWLSAQYSF
ncbi:MAG: hypothetical protein Q8916_06020 [Bacteroidota bacterium]|nr:hypothetical protein [Bacteroidota bacterium]